MRTRPHETRFALASWLPVSLALVVAAGCSGSPEATYPVRGKVTVDGVPATCGTVQFESSGEGSTGEVYSARGTISTEGDYLLTTFEPNDGAVAGRHRVVVIPDLSRKGSNRPSYVTAPYVDIPERYTLLDKPILEFEVKPGENVFNIEMTTKESK